MKKHFLKGVLVVIGLLMAPGLYVSAQSPSNDNDALILQLEEQIQQLLDQVESLRAQLHVARGEVVEVRQELQLTRSLFKGSSGDDVEELQQFLKQFPDVYPEGLTTGYFGPLTEKAVKKFQKKYGIEQVGIVGPKTRAQLHKLVGKTASSVPQGIAKKKGVDSDDSDDDTDDTDNGDDTDGDDSDDGDEDDDVANGGHGKGKVLVCHKGKNTINISRAALQAHLRIGGTEGACGEQNGDPDDGDDLDNPPEDTTAPSISGVGADPATTTAAVSWATDEPADSTVWYATSSPLLDATSILVGENSATTTSHSLTLENLTTSTMYYYIVFSDDEAGNTASSSEGSFQTLTE